MNTHYLNSLPQEWEHIARVFAALGDSTRQKMLLLFEGGETINLKTLVDLVPLSRSAVVHHVTVLEQAGLVVAKRCGREVGYTLHTAPLIASLEGVLDYAKNLGEISSSTASPCAGIATSTGPEPLVLASAECSAGPTTKNAAILPQAITLFTPLSAQEIAHD